MAVPSERPGMEDRAAPAVAASSSLLDNVHILSWLDVLLKGKPEEQAVARTEIALILEARGHTEDAEEAYWTNVQARATDRRPYERLIALYQQRKDRLSETLVRRQLDEVFGPREAPVSSNHGDEADGPVAPTRWPLPPAFQPPPMTDAQPAGQPGPRASLPAPPTGQPTPAARPALRLRSAGRAAADQAPQPHVLPGPALQGSVTAPVRQAGPPVDRASQDRGRLDRSRDRVSSPRQPSQGRVPGQRGHVDDVPVARLDDPSRRPLLSPARIDRPPRSRSSPAGPARRREPAPPAVRLAATHGAPHAQAVPMHALAPGSGRAVPAEVIPPSAGRNGRPRRAPLSPNPSRHWPANGGLVALQPATIAAFLLASVGAAALIAFITIAVERGNARLPLAAAAQAPARCVDGALRFPGGHDPRGAVAGAYRQLGVDVDAPRPGGPRLTADQAELVIGSWMAVSLMLEHAGQTAPKLAEWLDSEPGRPTLANAILAGRGLDSMLTREEWAEIRSWPASNCEGAFVRDDRNAGLVRLIERVVSR